MQKFKAIMANDFRTVFLILTMASFASCFCPPRKVQNVGHCSFRIHCVGTINNISLPISCQGSTNFPVRIELTLTEAIDRFDDSQVEPDFLNSIKTLRVSADWPQTSLSILGYLPNLEQLYLTGNEVEHITHQPFYYQNLLENIDLSHNRLTDVNSLFLFESGENKLKRLSLAFNLISSILDYAFDELTSLIELDLSNNYLSDLTEEPFSNLTNLQTLNLNNNKIKDLNGALNNLHNLKHLFVRGNNLQNIDAESLEVIYHLETFDLSSNNLDKLKPTVFWRHWLHFEDQQFCKIILSDNHITYLANATFINKEMTDRFKRNLFKNRNVEVLTELDLSKNEISNVEYNAFQIIFQLTYLDLSHNKLNDFSVNPEHLSDVRFLNLSYNNIIALSYESFSSMKKLHNLDFSHNKLDYLPDKPFIVNFNLKNVNLTHNSLTKIFNIRIPMFHPDGGKLDLSNNGLTTLVIPFDEGRLLTMLVLESNNITDPANIELRDQDDLKTLIMRKNQIGDLNDNSFRLPVGLDNLDLSYNVITDIQPSTFHSVGYLQTLRLSYNFISFITYGSFHGLKQLKNLDLSYNKLSYLDSRVLLDLKTLRVLSVRFNELMVLDDKGWVGHKFDLQVFVEGNNLTCSWLSKALTNYNNGFSKMKPAVMREYNIGHTIEGIPCVEDSEMSENLVDLGSRYVDTDERLLMTNQKILEAVKEQTYFLKRIYWHSIQDNNARINNNKN